jgi:hypothetical protein
VKAVCRWWRRAKVWEWERRDLWRLDWACSRSNGLGGWASVGLWGRVWFMEFLVGLRWLWIVVVGGGGFPTGFAVGGRGGGGGGFLS